MFSTVNEFDKMIKKNWEYPVYDGITDKELYDKTKHKILWILKEPNKSEDLTKIWDHRAFHYSGTAGYDKWYVTYKKIHYVSYGLTNPGISRWDDLPDIDMETAEIEGRNALRNVAIININKSGGGPTSNQNNIDEIYNKKKEILHKQIDGISPDIIINASRCNSLFVNLSNGCKISKLKNSKLRYCITSDKLIIDYYHPAVRVKGLTEEKYCDAHCCPKEI